jgi:histidyl-tRNA synthetase
MDESLNDPSRAFFARVREGLDALGIDHEINPALVRGLDYYTHTAFEFTTTALGAQGAVIAGGRYDGLVSTMGGPEIPGVGWAAGVERLAMLIEAPAEARPIAVVPVDETSVAPALQLAEELRAARLVAEFGFKGRVGQRLKQAARQNARWAVLLGPDEIAAGRVQLKDLDSGEQADVGRSDLVSRLRS